MLCARLMEDLTPKSREIMAPRKPGFERGDRRKRVCEPQPSPVMRKQS